MKDAIFRIICKNFKKKHTTVKDLIRTMLIHLRTEVSHFITEHT